jgi:NAD(P)H-hydrate epimerase
MFAAGRKEMMRMDQYTIEELGLPSVVLMENAGAKVVEEILASPAGVPSRVVVLAGGGNNGGDGFVIARRLADAHIETLLCLLVPAERITGDAEIHLNTYLKRELPLLKVWEQDPEALKIELMRADLIVDAMLGTGGSGALREPLRQTISLVNELQGLKPVIAVDIPSGLGSDDGKVEDIAIRATKTVTFVFPKKGFFLLDGPTHVGEWKAVDISVPPSIVEPLQLDMPRVITESLLKSSLPKRPRHGHKGTFGHALIVGGSRTYAGAPVFAAKAVIHAGAGLVTTALPASLYPIAAAQMPESIFLPLPEADGYIAERAWEQLAPQLSQYQCIAIGPGIGKFPNGESWIRKILENLQGQSLVVDADALYLIRNSLDIVRNYKGNVIFTPHPGEMAMLLQRTVKEIEQDRLGIAHSFATMNQIYLLLKGHRTIIASPDGEVYINPYGHDALGKGGSGDVLTGLVASFLAQGAAPSSALIAASALHAKAGEWKARQLSHYGVMPLDVIDGVKEQLARMNHI